MVKAAREANRVAIGGTHRRVSPHNISAREFIRSGKLGKVGLIKAFVNYGGGPETPLKNIEPPKELDWDMWCGPAPLRPYCGSLDNPWGGGPHPRGFRSYLDYANGQMGDWGIHWIDQIHWILDLKQPKRVFSIGGRPIQGPPILNEEEQTSDAPDHQIATFEYENDINVYWEHRKFAGNNQAKGENVGCYFYGTKGVLHLGWISGWAFYPSWQGEIVSKPENGPSVISKKPITRRQHVCLPWLLLKQDAVWIGIWKNAPSQMLQKQIHFLNAPIEVLGNILSKF